MAYNGYKELNDLKPEAFLVWEAFDTAFDGPYGGGERGTEQYQKGLEIGHKSRYVFICCNSTWGARGKDGSQTSSYEGIGYHSCTKWLLRGFLDSGCPVKVYRSGPNATWIVGTEEEANAR
jgi:hypothetical protein